MNWPKEPKLRPDGTYWNGQVHEGGSPPNGEFDILLVDVSDTVNDRFQSWLTSGIRTGNYPGLGTADLGDVRILDSKRYHLIE